MEEQKHIGRLIGTVSKLRKRLLAFETEMNPRDCVFVVSSQSQGIICIATTRESGEEILGEDFGRVTRVRLDDIEDTRMANIPSLNNATTEAFKEELSERFNCGICHVASCFLPCAVVGRACACNDYRYCEDHKARCFLCSFPICPNCSVQRNGSWECKKCP